VSYIKATDVLPQELLDLIQKYVEGEYIYIPKKECNRKLGEKLLEVKRKFLREMQIFIGYMKMVLL
jgi:hypothetical protein